MPERCLAWRRARGRTHHHIQAYLACPGGGGIREVMAACCRSRHHETTEWAARSWWWEGPGEWPGPGSQVQHGGSTENQRETPWGVSTGPSTLARHRHADPLITCKQSVDVVSSTAEKGLVTPGPRTMSILPAPHGPTFWRNCARLHPGPGSSED